jgi:hypothetical protein
MSCEFCGIDTKSGGSGDFEMQAFTKYCKNCQENIDKNIIGKKKEVISGPTSPRQGFTFQTIPDEFTNSREYTYPCKYCKATMTHNGFTMSIPPNSCDSCQSNKQNFIKEHIIGNPTGPFKFGTNDENGFKFDENNEKKENIQNIIAGPTHEFKSESNYSGGYNLSGGFNLGPTLSFEQEKKNDKKRKREDNIIKVVFKIGDSDPYSYIKYIKKDELTLKLLIDIYKNEFKVEKEIILVCDYNKYVKEDYTPVPEHQVIITEENLNYLISEVKLFSVDHISKKYYDEDILNEMK